MENQQNIKPNQRISSDILDDLASRFIINIPVEERSDLIRLCFQIELAYWFYIDFICKQNPSGGGFTGIGNKVFAMQVFQHIPFLREHVSTIDKIFDDWRQYKLSVPTYGAIILSEDLKYVLLVQSFWAKSSWGFPKGKINETEPPLSCAIREVLEETGFDISQLIDPNEYIESVVSDQFTRLYIVPNVPRNTNFQPQTRNEIKSCEWFRLEYLPVSRHDTVSKQNLGINSNSFFMITPFMKRLKKWVNDRTRSSSVNGTSCSGGRQRHHSTGDLETLKRGGKNNNTNGNTNKAQNRRSQNISSSSPFSNINPNTTNGRNSITGNPTSTSKIFTNSKIAQIFDFHQTPPQQTPAAASTEKQIKYSILTKSEPPKRKLFSTPTSTSTPEQENFEKTQRIKKKYDQQSLRKLKKKITIKFPNETSLQTWKTFKFDLNAILPKF